MNSDFLNRPIWQQYLVCFLLLSLIFGIGYLFFIQNIVRQYNQQLQLYHTKNSEINLLQAKLARYQASKNSSLNLISEKEFAQAIEHNHLTLNSFKRRETESTINWDIELNGKFIDFMNLIISFNDDYFYFDFNHLMIEGQDQQLQIIFTLLFKKGTM